MYSERRFQEISPNTRNFKEDLSMKRSKDNVKLLQNEAEKIRNWHIQTELHSRKTDEMVKNLQKTVDMKNKSIMDFQLQTQSLKSKLDKEINSRAACHKKMEANREICIYLKSQVQGMETSIQNSEKVTKEIALHGENRQKIVLDLSNDLKNLCEIHNDAKETFSSNLNEKEKAYSELENEYNTTKKSQTEKITGLEKELHENTLVKDSLMHQVIKAESILVDKTINLKSLQLSLNNVVKENEELTLNSKLRESIIQENNEEIKDKENRIAKLKQQILDVQSREKELTVNYNNQLTNEKTNYLQEVGKLHDLSLVQQSGLEQYKLKIEALEMDAISVFAAKQQLEYELNMLDERSKKLTTELHATQEFSKHEKEKFEQEISNQKSEYELLNMNFISNQKLSQNFEMEIKELSLAVDRLNAEKSSLESAKQEMEQKLIEIEKDLLVTKDNLNNETLARKKVELDLCSEREVTTEIKEDCDTLKTELKTSNSSETKLQANIVKLNSKIAKLEEKNRNLSASLKATKQENLMTEQNLSVEKEKNEQSLIQNQDMEKELMDEIEDLKTLTEKLTSDKNEISEEKIAVEEKLIEVENLLKSANEAVDLQKLNQNEFQDEISSNRNVIRKLNEEIGGLENKIKKTETLIENVSELNNKINALEKTNEDYKVEIRDLKSTRQDSDEKTISKLRDLELELKSKDIVINDKSRALESSTQFYNELDEIRKRQDIQIKELEKSLSTTKERLKDRNTLIKNKCEKEIITLQTELEKYKAICIQQKESCQQKKLQAPKNTPKLSLKKGKSLLDEQTTVLQPSLKQNKKMTPHPRKSTEILTKTPEKPKSKRQRFSLYSENETSTDDIVIPIIESYKKIILPSHSTPKVKVCTPKQQKPKSKVKTENSKQFSGKSLKKSPWLNKAVKSTEKRKSTTNFWLENDPIYGFFD